MNDKKRQAESLLLGVQILVGVENSGPPQGGKWLGNAQGNTCVTEVAPSQGVPQA